MFVLILYNPLYKLCIMRPKNSKPQPKTQIPINNNSDILPSIKITNNDNKKRRHLIYV